MRRLKFTPMAAIAACALTVLASSFALAPAAAEAPLDTSKLARIPGAKETYASPATTIFASSKSVADTAATLSGLLAADGWQSYTDPFGTKAEMQNMETMTLKKGKHGLTVLITQAPAQGNATSVSYVANPIADDLPFLADGTEIKYAPSRPHLSLTTATPLDTALATLRDGLTARGWNAWSRKSNGPATAGEDTSEPNDAGRFVFFVRDGHRPLMLMVRERKDGLRDATIEAVPQKLLTLPQANANATPESATPSEDPAHAAAADAARKASDAFDTLTNEIMKDVRRATDEALADLGAAAKKSPTSPRLAPQVEILTPAEPAKAVEPIELKAEDKAGLPVPAPNSLSGSEKTLFRVSAHANVTASVEQVLAFYRRELNARGWTEVKGASKSAERADVAFASPDGPAMLKLERKGDVTFATLTLRNEKAARASGMLPSSGKTKLMFGNILETNAELTVGKTKVKIPAGHGADKPDGPTIELAPGKHTYSLRVPGQPDLTEEIEVASGDIWALMVGPGGVLALPMY